MPREQKQLYHVVDRSARSIAGEAVTAEHRKNGILLMPSAAAFDVANGTISTQPVAENEELQRMQKGFTKARNMGVKAAAARGINRRLVEAGSPVEALDPNAPDPAMIETTVVARAVDPTPDVGDTEQRPRRSR